MLIPYLHSSQGGPRQRRPRPSTERIIHNLPALGIPNQHNPRIRAPLVQAVHGRDDGRGTLALRLAVLDAAAAGLPAAGWVRDGRGLRARVGLENEIDEALGCAVSGGDGGLAGAKDVDAWAALAGVEVDVDVDRVCGGEASQGRKQE